MKRKRVPWVICLLLLLLGACDRPLGPLLPLDETETARAATAAEDNSFANSYAIGVTATARAKAAQATATAAAAATAIGAVAATQAALSAPPTATVTPPTATATNTIVPLGTPALGKIGDVCGLFDENWLNSNFGDKFGNKFGDKKKFVTQQGENQCYASLPNGDAAILGVAQGDVPIFELVGDIIAIKGAPDCNNWARLKPPSSDAVNQQRAVLSPLYPPDQFVAGLLALNFKAVVDKGCADVNGWTEVPGAGDKAVSDASFGLQEFRVAFRQTLFFFDVSKGGASNADELAIDKNWWGSSVSQKLPTGPAAAGPTTTATP